MSVKLDSNMDRSEYLLMMQNYQQKGIFANINRKLSSSK